MAGLGSESALPGLDVLFGVPRGADSFEGDQGSSAARGHGELFFGSERGALTDLSAAEGDVAHPSDFPVRRSSLNCTLTMVP